ncbi:MAG: hypothetical protein HPAVJP_1840 [Candidatus Hepatoplasma vulgare]|nr:MAG: hypothetical protein HPAVJP_1840 [Candidatus Hepatoplasma sp.]
MKNKNLKINDKKLFYDEYLEEIKKLNDDILNNKPIWGGMKNSSKEVKIILKDDNDLREETKFNILI